MDKAISTSYTVNVHGNKKLAKKNQRESRIGKLPIKIPKNVEVNIKENTFAVKGPKVSLERTIPEEISLKKEGDIVMVSSMGLSKDSKAKHGLFRALCNNMIIGVSEGFSKQLSMVGVGYRATLSNGYLNLNIGYCHTVDIEIPKGVTVKVEKNTELIISGYDKEKVTNFAAIIRSKRPPEPYRGKGIRYFDEKVKLKEGKKGK